MHFKVTRLMMGAGLLGVLALAGCSSSSGGGSSPSKQPNAVVLPPGARIVCADGNPPPCQ